MTAVQRLLLVIGSGLVLLALVAFILYPVFKGDEEEPVVVAPVVDVDPVTQLAPLPPDQPPSRTTEEQVVIEPLAGESVAKNEAVARGEVERLTRLFVERFGSYSNFSNFSNISSIESFMTSSMKAYAQSFVESESVGTISGYYGVTTNIIGLKIDSINFDSSATVNIIVQEAIQDGFNAEIQRRNRDGRVELVYSGGKWLVDGVYYN